MSCWSCCWACLIGTAHKGVNYFVINEHQINESWYIGCPVKQRQSSSRISHHLEVFRVICHQEIKNQNASISSTDNHWILLVWHRWQQNPIIAYLYTRMTVPPTGDSPLSGFLCDLPHLPQPPIYITDHRTDISFNSPMTRVIVLLL